MNHVTFSFLKKLLKKRHFFFYMDYPCSISNFGFIDLCDCVTGVHYRTRNYHVSQLKLFVAINFGEV